MALGDVPEGRLGRFVVGLVMAGLGLYLFLARVNVTSNFSSLWGGHFGLILLPLGLGIALVVFKSRSIAGWLLTAGSLAAIFISILANLTFYFQSTNLIRTIGMVALLSIGVVMMARSLRSSD